MRGVDTSPALAEFWAKEWICRHHPRKWVVQPASRLPGMSRNTACHPLALVIGLAVGETRWRDMTAEAGGRDYLVFGETPFFDASIGASEGFWGRLAQYFR